MVDVVLAMRTYFNIVCMWVLVSQRTVYTRINYWMQSSPGRQYYTHTHNNLPMENIKSSHDFKICGDGCNASPILKLWILQKIMPMRWITLNRYWSPTRTRKKIWTNSQCHSPSFERLEHLFVSWAQFTPDWRCGSTGPIRWPFHTQPNRYRLDTVDQPFLFHLTNGRVHTKLNTVLMCIICYISMKDWDTLASASIPIYLMLLLRN